LFKYNATPDQWLSILELAGRWGLTSVREAAIMALCDHPNIDPLLHLKACAKHKIDLVWAKRALAELCKREAAVTAEEARSLNMDIVFVIGDVREQMMSKYREIGAINVMESEVGKILSRLALSRSSTDPPPSDLANLAGGIELIVTQPSPPIKHDKYYIEDGDVVFLVSRIKLC
jgi:hypothetical protein